MAWMLPGQEAQRKRLVLSTDRSSCHVSRGNSSVAALVAFAPYQIPILLRWHAGADDVDLLCGDTEIEDDDDADLGPETQIITTGCWLSMKEAALVIGKIAEHAPMKGVAVELPSHLILTWPSHPGLLAVPLCSLSGVWPLLMLLPEDCRGKMECQRLQNSLSLVHLLNHGHWLKASWSYVAEIRKVCF